MRYKAVKPNKNNINFRVIDTKGGFEVCTCTVEYGINEAIKMSKLIAAALNAYCEGKDE